MLKFFLQAFLSRGIKPQPSIIDDLHKSGVIIKVYPFFLKKSTAQLIKANSNIAASFFKKTNLDFAIFVAFSKSNKSYFLPISI
jgi:hypothetical protein